jgi:N utilization substance protein A
VTLDEENKIARVKAPEDQLSLAIGRDGQNVRLAAKLTGYRIEVEGTAVEAEKEPQEEPVAPKTVKPKSKSKTKSKKAVMAAAKATEKPDEK